MPLTPAILPVVGVKRRRRQPDQRAADQRAERRKALDRHRTTLTPMPWKSLLSLPCAGWM